MAKPDELKLYRALADAGYIDTSLFELTADDRADGFTSVIEKLELTVPSDIAEGYAVFELADKDLVVFTSEDGVAEYAKDKLMSLEDPEAVTNLLGQFTDNFKDLLAYWGVKTVKSEGEYTMAESPKAGYIKNLTSTLIRTAAGTGIGQYRRGKVLTDVQAVEPGQLLAHESIIYKAINLIKVTQTFKDKFFAIFVNPENPNEKSKASDEEFVVHPTDLERGEYYIALEPAPAGTAPAAGDASGVGTKPVPAVPVEPQTEVAETAPEVAAEVATAASKKIASIVVDSIGTIEGIQDRMDLTLVDRDTDVEAIKDYLGNDEDVNEFGGFFVKIGEGDYEEIYGFYGVVPDLDKNLYKIEFESEAAGVSASKTAAYYEGFERQYEKQNEGAVEVEAVLHKYDLKLEDLDEALKNKLLMLANQFTMADADWTTLAFVDYELSNGRGIPGITATVNKTADVYSEIDDVQAQLRQMSNETPVAKMSEEQFAQYKELKNRLSELMNKGYTVKPLKAAEKAGIKSPVRQNLDYGVDETNLKRIESKMKLAFGEEPASALERPSANPCTVADPTHADPEEDVTGYSRYAEGQKTAADAPDVEETEEQEPADVWEFRSVFNTTKELNDFIAERGGDEGSDEDIVINEDEYRAYYGGRKIAEGRGENYDERMSSLAEEVKDWMDASHYKPEVMLNGAPQTIVKVGAIDNFEYDEKQSSVEGYGVIGSQQSTVSRLLANIETLASATGGEGDDGSAYDLVDGRNFTGVDENMVEGSVQEYLEGKATSFASFADFAGFVEDVYGIAKTESVNVESAWHDADAPALVSFIKTRATKDLLK